MLLLRLSVILAMAQGLVTTRGRSGRGSLRMAALEVGSTVLVLGGGPVQLLTAKQAALKGFKTFIFTSSDPEPSLELIYDEVACPRGSLPLTFLQVTDKEACEAVLAECSAVLIASDSDNPVSERVLDTVIPDDEPTQVKKVVIMSRNGVTRGPNSGKGLGFFAKSAKDFSNAEVWAAGDDVVAKYQVLERKLVSKCASVDAAYTILRAGTLKGGGPGASSTKDGKSYPQAAVSLSASYYRTGPAGRNWRSLFDTSTQGVEFVPGDTVEGPGFAAVGASTSPDVQKGDTGRLGIAAAMVQCLLQERAENADFSVVTSASRTPPTQEEWDNKFQAME